MNIKQLTLGILLVSFGIQTASASIDQNLKYGQRSNEVFELQDFLIDKGFNTQSTGFFGLLTLKAVQQYQTSVGVPSTGYVGVLTRQKINEELTTLLIPSTVAESQEVKKPIITQLQTTFIPTYAPPVPQTTTRSPALSNPQTQPDTSTAQQTQQTTPQVAVVPQLKSLSLTAAPDFITQTIQANTNTKLGSFIFDAGERNINWAIGSITVVDSSGLAKNFTVKINDLLQTPRSETAFGSAVYVSAFETRRIDVYGEAATGTLRLSIRVSYRNAMTNVADVITADGSNIEVR